MAPMMEHHAVDFPISLTVDTTSTITWTSTITDYLHESTRSTSISSSECGALEAKIVNASLTSSSEKGLSLNETEGKRVVIQRPVIVVPWEVKTSKFHMHSPSLQDTLVEATIFSAPTTTSKRRTESPYPRPSPPTFLYPQPIVPLRDFPDRQLHHAAIGTRQQNLHQPLLSTRYTRSMRPFDLPGMPTPAQAVLFLALAFGFTWVITVWLINSPSKAKSSKKGTARSVTPPETDSKTVPNKSLKSTLELTTSHYSAEDAKAHTWSSAISPCPSTSPLPTPHSLRNRMRKQHDLPTQPTLFKQPQYRCEDQSERKPSLSHAAPVSTVNPFLPPHTVKPRSSTEYMAAHTAFFTARAAASNNVLSCASKSLSASTSTSHLFTSDPAPAFSFDDIDALEAQTDVWRAQRREKSETGLGVGVGVGGKKGIGRGWLGAVDEAVSWGVDRVVRWTEDAGDEEGLLLSFKREGG